MKRLNDNDAKHYFEILGYLMRDASERFVYVADDVEYLENAMRPDNEYFSRLLHFIWTTDSIDRYIENCEGTLAEEDMEILQSWKQKKITSEFLIVKHTDDGSLFLDAHTEKLYLVKGLQSTIEEMSMDLPLPLYINTTLLPFKDMIISDGTGGVGQFEDSADLDDYLKNVLTVKRVIREL